jgi:ABC-type glycerol-3-phosphate transport system substrate-binding protein
MKKHIYNIIVGLLVGITAFGMTGCSDTIKNQKSSAYEEVLMGRYIEEPIEIPKDIKAIIDYKVKSDGTLELYGYGSENQVIAYTSKDGESWESKEAAWLSELVNGGNSIQQITYNEKGEYYIYYYNQDFRGHLGKLSSDHKIDNLPYEIDEGSYISRIQAIENGEILLGMDSGVVRINVADGSIIGEYTVTATEGDFVVVQDKLIVIDTQRGGIVVFNLESNNEEAFIPYPGELGGSKLLSDDEGRIYIANTEGISRLAPDSSIWENIIEGSTSTFGTPSLAMKAVAIKDNDEFIINFNSKESGDMLISYSFNPNVPSRRPTQLNLYMLEDNRTIRQAVAEYQRQNQEVVVNMQVGLSESDAITKSDAIRTLNTQLLSGKGPDILVLDGLPIQSYMEKDVLLNMSDWIDGMKDSGKLIENITEAYREEDGTIYALPTRFTIPTLWGNAELVNGVSSLEELAGWAKANPDKKVFNSMMPEELIKTFYGITAHQWMDKKGQIKEEAFVIFLDAIKALAKQGGADTRQSSEGSYDHSPARNMAQKEVELYIAELTGFMDIPYLSSAIMQRGDGDFGPVLDKNDGVYRPVGIIGINANSKNQDIAREIVKMAMSKEVQEVDLYDGFSINKEVLEKQVKIDKDAMTTSQAQRQPETQIAYTKLKEQVDKLMIPAVTDEVLMNLIIEETKGYFDGEKTAKEAAAAVTTRTRAYLAE